jgi:adenosylmethionine-8-amino-7-oxononanoate aminotransferase
MASPDNRSLVERSLKSVWHPCTQMKAHERLPLVAVARGEGVWLYDFEGRRYLDAVSSWWVNLFGHANPRINAALRDQLETLEHVMLAGFTHAPVVELSEKLAALTGGRLGHCFYASDGASAVEIALKMSMHYWRNSGRPEKNRYLNLAGSYHGESAGALAVTDVALFRDAYAPLLRPAVTVPSPDARLAEAGETPAAYAARCAAELDAYLDEHHQVIAALIVEPLVQCASGMAMYDAEHLRLAHESCQRHQVHLIADEIAVGCGRTGTFFACEQAGAGVWPDFLCLSKGISGGYLPLSLVMTTPDVYAAFYDDEVTRGFLHSHSYTGNPLACRAALATLEIFASDDVLNANRTRAAFLDTQAAELRSRPWLRHWRQRGMIWAFDVDSDDPQFARRVFAAALQRGLLLRPIGKTVYFMPPYVIGEDDIVFMLLQALATLDEVLAHG